MVACTNITENKEAKKQEGTLKYIQMIQHPLQTVTCEIFQTFHRHEFAQV